jgi:L-histidine Nalpha-methyltransferase
MHKEGGTAAFNPNVLHRLNGDPDADFDPDGFRNRAIWNPAESRIEMHLESIREQRACIAAVELDVEFLEGETIHTNNIYKFTDESVSQLLEDSVLQIETISKDEPEWCAVVLARHRPIVREVRHERRASLQPPCREFAISTVDER